MNAILPAIRVPFHRPAIGKSERELVNQVLDNGWLTTGATVARFEEEFAAKVGSPHALAVNSATMGALLVLSALGVGLGDDVVVPAWTFSGPAMMAHMLGARVVLCDVDPVTANMTPETLARVITPTTKVVMPTHFAGRACDVTEIAAVAAEHGAVIVDDAAHAFPTDYQEGLVVGGRHPDVAATFFSFYATKTLTCGEGGMITTSTTAIADKIRRLRLHGMSREAFDRYTAADAMAWCYDVRETGWKANLSDLHAAVGLGNLRRADFLQACRSGIAHRYVGYLSGVDGVAVPSLRPQSSWHLFPIRVLLEPPNAAVDVKGAFIAEMLKIGVRCSVHFIPLHYHTFWRPRAAWSDLSHAEDLAGQMVSLPIYPSMSNDDIEYVAEAVKFSLGQLKARWGLA